MADRDQQTVKLSDGQHEEEGDSLSESEAEQLRLSVMFHVNMTDTNKHASNTDYAKTKESLQRDANAAETLTDPHSSPTEPLEPDLKLVLASGMWLAAGITGGMFQGSQ